VHGVQRRRVDEAGERVREVVHVAVDDVEVLRVAEDAPELAAEVGGEHLAALRVQPRACSVTATGAPPSASRRWRRA